MQLHGSPVAGFEAFDELLRIFSEQHAVPGAALAVGRAGVLLYARSIGFAHVEDKIPVEPHSLFRIASISKPITAVAILQQVERGQLTLDSRVWELLKLDEPSDPRWKVSWSFVSSRAMTAGRVGPKVDASAARVSGRRRGDS